MLPTSPISCSEKAHGFFIGISQKNYREKPIKNDQDQGRYSFEDSLRRLNFFLQKTFIERAMINARQIMNGLKKTNVCSSGLTPQLEK